MTERIDQIRRAHDSAKPTAQNPAWLHSHNDCGVLLARVDNLENALRNLLQITKSAMPYIDRKWISMGAPDGNHMEMTVAVHNAEQLLVKAKPE